MNNNQRLKHLHAALKLNDADIARAATLGGVPTSRNRAKSWLRGKSARRERDGSQQRRFIEISQDEFDAVLIGLRAMLDEADRKNGIYSQQLSPQQNAALARLESLTGTPPLGIEEFESGDISAKQLWQQNIEWLEGVLASAQNLPFPNTEQED
ncbi:DUF1456 family protein [Vreelandella alkaliphila]|uniref:DUF1456 family protein n=1 Tax=Vreelandella alkaliphila TaxID=272774 RepID=A0AAJ2VSE2_9GAMM|nr:DUF1456 family protein [Halomonas alkaliphila]MDX5979559.1 DUF1456 family protein [Halomonas alkaliphila]